MEGIGRLGAIGGGSRRDGFSREGGKWPQHQQLRLWEFLARRVPLCGRSPAPTPAQPAWGP